MKSLFLPITALFLIEIPSPAAEAIPQMPAGTKLVLAEDWSGGKIDPKRWYALRKQWGQGNAGVVPENLAIVKDTVAGASKNVLRCTANGDQYDGQIVGQRGMKKRVGGVLVSKQHFASGRFEVVLKIGDRENPRPRGWFRRSGPMDTAWCESPRI